MSTVNTTGTLLLGGMQQLLSPSKASQCKSMRSADVKTPMIDLCKSLSSWQTPNQHVIAHTLSTLQPQPAKASSIVFTDAAHFVIWASRVLMTWQAFLDIRYSHVTFLTHHLRVTRHQAWSAVGAELLINIKDRQSATGEEELSVSENLAIMVCGK